MKKAELLENLKRLFPGVVSRNKLQGQIEICPASKFLKIPNSGDVANNILYFISQHPTRGLLRLILVALAVFFHDKYLAFINGEDFYWRRKIGKTNTEATVKQFRLIWISVLTDDDF